VDTPAKTFGLPQRFLAHGDRNQILADLGLTPQHLARELTEAVARRSPVLGAGQQEAGQPVPGPQVARPQA
jgi:1-deoxy-D-xylulose-5-phosphate synthase